MKLETEKNRVRVRDHWWRFSEPIADAVQIGTRVFVIFDYMAFPPWSPAPNLRAYDLQQNELWRAEHPIDIPTSAYVHFLSESPLAAWNFACFQCVLDEATGALVEAHFTK